MKIVYGAMDEKDETILALFILPCSMSYTERPEFFEKVDEEFKAQGIERVNAWNLAEPARASCPQCRRKRLYHACLLYQILTRITEDK